MTTQDLLGIYLNDHLAGAITGTGLARRMAASAEPGTERAATLSQVRGPCAPLCTRRSPAYPGAALRPIGRPVPSWVGRPGMCEAFWRG
jgi:hypothetical protein